MEQESCLLSLDPAVTLAESPKRRKLEIVELEPRLAPSNGSGQVGWGC